MSIYILKNNKISITVIDKDITEREKMIFDAKRSYPVYSDTSGQNLRWIIQGNWDDLLKFCGIDSSGSIDFAYPQGYKDIRVNHDQLNLNLSGPMWDYRNEKTHGIGLPLYKSEVFEVVSALIKFMIQNNFYEKYERVPGTERESGYCSYKRVSYKPIFQSEESQEEI